MFYRSILEYIWRKGVKTKLLLFLASFPANLQEETLLEKELWQHSLLCYFKSTCGPFFRYCKRQEHLIQAALRAFKYHTGKFVSHFLNMRLDYFSIFLQRDSLSLFDFGMHAIKITLMFSKVPSKNVRCSCFLELVPLLFFPRDCRNVRTSELKSSLHKWIAFILNTICCALCAIK